MEALFLGVGVLIGAAIVYFLVVRGLQTKVDAQSNAQTEIAVLKKEIEGLKSNHEEKLRAYEDAEKRLKESFDSVALKNLQEAATHYKGIANEDLEQRRKSIEEILKPFNERLKELQSHNSEIEKSRADAYGAMLSQIRALGEEQVGLRKETNRLVKALQDPGSAGSWGEMVLERVVEMAGLEEHYSFDQQSTEASEDGNQRPDMIVNLPGGRILIIDSKAPMRAYMEGLETHEEEARQTFFRAHAGKLYEHAKELKRRDYSKRDGAPDFTVMFIPSESAFRTAVESRPSLIEECMECNVVVATPTTLLALLRAVNYGWRQEKLAQLAHEVQKDGAELYNRICKLAEHYEKLGKALKNAGIAYNDFGGTLETRVLPAARRFKENGVQTNKDVAVVEPIEFDPRPLQNDELRKSNVLPFAEHSTGE